MQTFLTEVVREPHTRDSASFEWPVGDQQTKCSYLISCTGTRKTTRFSTSANDESGRPRLLALSWPYADDINCS